MGLMTDGQLREALTGLTATVSALRETVAELRGSISRITWVVPLFIAIGFGVVAFLQSTSP